MNSMDIEREVDGFLQPVSGTDLAFASLADALRRRRIPIENHALITRIVAAAGADEFVNRSGYIKAVGRNAELHIHFGYTNGIPSEAEAHAILADHGGPGAQVYKSKRKWGIAHPVNAIRDGNGARRQNGRSQRDYGTCPECTYKIYANGTCGCA